MTKSYGQFCGLARALDVVGERWSFLIVRQLLVAPARYGELLAALPLERPEGAHGPSPAARRAWSWATTASWAITR